MNLTNRLNDRVALVTGSGRGLGAATALRLAREGAHLIINDLNADNAKQVAEQVKALGKKAMVSQHDVSDHAAAQALVADAKRQFGRLDILVNNAGITRDAMLHKLTEENWDLVVKVNLKGVFNMGQAAAKVMMEQKSGVIINFASVARLGNVGQTNYSATKAGVVGMTSTWAIELSKHGIRANAIAPGMIDTPMTQAVPADVKEKLNKAIPLRRMGTPEEIAATVAFLASDDASYITGQCIGVDGGMSTGVGMNFLLG